MSDIRWHFQAMAVVGATAAGVRADRLTREPRLPDGRLPLPRGVLQVVVEEARQEPALLAKSALPGPNAVERARRERVLEGGAERRVGLPCLRVEDDEVTEAEVADVE